MLPLVITSDTGTDLDISVPIYDVVENSTCMTTDNSNKTKKQLYHLYILVSSIIVTCVSIGFPRASPRVEDG